jgi:hypothetical protein
LGPRDGRREERHSYRLRGGLARVEGRKRRDFGRASPGPGSGNQARARSIRRWLNSTGRSGMVMRKVAPMVPSTRLSSPPWARTSSAAMARPSPVPPARAEP